MAETSDVFAAPDLHGALLSFVPGSQGLTSCAASPRLTCRHGESSKPRPASGDRAAAEVLLVLFSLFQK